MTDEKTDKRLSEIESRLDAHDRNIAGILDTFRGFNAILQSARTTVDEIKTPRQPPQK